jgi:hypothetical protein
MTKIMFENFEDSNACLKQLKNMQIKEISSQYLILKDLKDKA